MATLGERIKAYRKDKGWSTEEFAKVIGKDRSTVYRYENNEIMKIPADILSRMANSLNCPVETFFEEASGAGGGRLEEEKSILRTFRSLNELGRARMMSFASDMARISDYRQAQDASPLSATEIDYLLTNIESMEFWKGQGEDEC